MPRPKLTRTQALKQLANQIAAMPDDHPEKAALLARYVRLNPIRARRKVRLAEVSAKAQRKLDIAEGTSPWWLDLSDEDRAAWRRVWALEAAQGINAGSLAHCGGPVTEAELAEARTWLADREQAESDRHRNLVAWARAAHEVILSNVEQE
jgi:hypothetical protein